MNPSFVSSKTLMWIVAPRPIIARLVQAKQGADLHTGTFVQEVF